MLTETAEQIANIASNSRRCAREYYRDRYLSVYVNGKYCKIKVDKRKYSEVCELCSKSVKLCYHHWDDNDLSKGIWLCNPCHIFAERVDEKLVNRYLLAKQVIDSEPFENSEDLKMWPGGEELGDVYTRSHHLRVYRNGRQTTVRVIKRLHTGHCELCKREVKLAYHHWDTIRLREKLKGLWLCGYCHTFAELMDKGVASVYLLKKQIIEKEALIRWIAKSGYAHNA